MATPMSPISHYGLHFTESTYKTFLCGEKIGISTCGDASVNGRPIAGYIESFINNIYKNDFSVEKTTGELISYFYNINPKLQTVFHVSGYTNENNVDKPVVIKAVVDENRYISIDTSSSGATWDGESETMSRLIKAIALPMGNINFQNKITLPTGDEINDAFIIEKKNTVLFEQADIPWNLLTLQDAVDFAIYAIKTTIDTMRFQLKVKSVGGPIDVLIVRPNEAKFLQRKELLIQ